MKKICLRNRLANLHSKINHTPRSLLGLLNKRCYCEVLCTAIPVHPNGSLIACNTALDTAHSEKWRHRAAMNTQCSKELTWQQQEMSVTCFNATHCLPTPPEHVTGLPTEALLKLDRQQPNQQQPNHSPQGTKCSLPHMHPAFPTSRCSWVVRVGIFSWPERGRPG